MKLKFNVKIILHLLTVIFVIFTFPMVYFEYMIYHYHTENEEYFSINDSTFRKMEFAVFRDNPPAGTKIPFYDLKVVLSKSTMKMMIEKYDSDEFLFYYKYLFGMCDRITVESFILKKNKIYNSTRLIGYYEIDSGILYLDILSDYLEWRPY